MLNLEFTGLAHRNRITVGPAPWFRLAGTTIETGETGLVVAELKHHWWRRGGRYFDRIECLDPVSLWSLEPDGRARAVGSFEDVAIGDGAIYAGGRLLAEYDDDCGRWRSLARTESAFLLLQAPDRRH
jgi:hypothetical protein